MGEIKSTLEIALEKAEKIGKASKEELELERLKEEAKRVAAKFMESQDIDLKESLFSLVKDKSNKFKKAVLESAIDVFLRNIILPVTQTQLKNAQIAVDGLRNLFKHIPEIENLCRELERFIQQYNENITKIYEELKERFSGGLEDLEKALSKEMGAEVKISVESHPQFKEQWQKIKDKVDQEYQRHLDYLKNIFKKLI